MAGRELKRKVVGWLRQGISPRRLAVTLALGFTIGCLPVVGAPTLLCAGLALGLGLNLPAIQAANYVAMPFQLALIVPFVKLGAKATAAGTPSIAPSALIHASMSDLALRMGGLAGEALLGWLLVAVPVGAFMTAALTVGLRQVLPQKAEAGD
jgi:uncharacterized protein (DUF2062 family)